MKVLYYFLALSLSVAALTQSCHYSCATCTGSSYTQCLSCSNSNQNVQYGVNCEGGDQNILSQIGGFCGSPAYSRGNPLGVIIIIIAIIAGSFLKSQYVFNFILSLQTIGLVGLIEVSFPFSLSLLLGSFDYFMLFSIMQQNTKPQNCKLMLRSMYRLNDFLGTTNFNNNSPLILAIVFFAATLLAAVSLFRAFRKSNCLFISDKTLDSILLCLRTVLLLTMQ
jgi:hypothetical protein